MKGLLILLIVTASYAYPVTRTWTFHELSRAISWKNPEESAAKDPEQKAMIDAFNEMMAALYSGKETYVQAILLSPSGSKVWTTEELTQVLTSNDTDPVLLPHLERSFTYLRKQNANENGTKQDTVEVWVPTLDISTWTENEVSTALKDPDVKPDLLPLLRSAQKEFDDPKEKGVKLESVQVITPVGVIPKPEGQPILFVARPVHDNMLANKEQLIALQNSLHHQKTKQ